MSNYYLASVEQKAIHLARRLGIRQLLGFVGLLPKNRPIDGFRGKMIARHIQGCGIEIGAMHLPTLVPPGVRVLYIDRISKAQAVANFPELDPEKIVDPDVITDGFLLDAFSEESQNFVIANHVLEHCDDPLGTLARWFRVLKPGGILFMAIPIAELCFDRGRKLTTLEHIVEDRRLSAEGAKTELYSRNFKHYMEWVKISQPAIARMHGSICEVPTEEELITRAKAMAAEHSEIHFHTFSSKSYRALLNYFASTTTPESKLLDMGRNGIEVVGILQKG